MGAASAADRPGRVATVGGMIGPIAMIVTALLALRVSSGPEASIGLMAAGTVFFGLVGLTLAAWAVWFLAAAGSLNGHHGWMAQPVVVLAVGLVAVVAEVVGVRRLGQIGVEV